MAAPVAVSAGPVLAHAPGAADNEGERRSQLAAAEFEVFLLSTTDLRPNDVTCNVPPAHDLDSDLLCFALVTDRDTITSVASVTGPDTYEFTPLGKFDPTGQVGPDGLPIAATATETATGPAQPDQLNAADGAALQYIADLTDFPDGLASNLDEQFPEFTSLEDFSYDAPTLTMRVTVTSSAGTAPLRDSLAFAITDTLSGLWEVDSPLRADETSIHPRLEVTVDGEIYGTPYDVMTRVADFDISFNEWLNIVTGNAGFDTVVRSEFEFHPGPVTGAMLVDHSI